MAMSGKSGCGVLCRAVLALVAGGLTGCAADSPATIRVLTYNIRHGAGMDDVVDLARIAAVIRRSEADLVALQEVDRGVARTGGVDQPARLAERTGMQPIFEKNINYQGGEYGNAVLTRLPVERHENHPLPQSLPTEQRGALEVRVQVDGRSLVFFATHLDYHADDGERLASVEMLRALVGDRPGTPVIIAGDLNATPDSRVIERARQVLTDAWNVQSGGGFTYPADAPVRRIDYILHSAHPDLRCVECRVIDEPTASDHRPVLAVFELDAPAEKPRAR